MLYKMFDRTGNVKESLRSQSQCEEAEEAAKGSTSSSEGVSSWP